MSHRCLTWEESQLAQYSASEWFGESRVDGKKERQPAASISKCFVMGEQFNNLHPNVASEFSPSLLRVIRMKYQSPNLNALSRPLTHKLVIHKRTVRHPSRAPIRLAIKALNQQHLSRRLLKQIMPLVIRARLHRVCLSLTVRIDQLDGHQLVVRDGVRFCDAQGVFEDCLDGPPDVDDLVAAFEQRFSFIGQVVGHARAAGGVGLVDVDALDGAAEGDGLGGVGFASILRLAADGVVEDEDARCAGAVFFLFFSTPFRVCQ